MQITAGDLTDPRVLDLLAVHLSRARLETERGSAHALDVSGLQSPDISFWTIWDEDVLLGMGALNQLARDHGEVKSMHTAQAMRRRGAGSAMLRHIIAQARIRGFSRLSLETGSWDYFKPAHRLYRSHGFVDCPHFWEYVPDRNSLFLTLDLRGSTSNPLQDGTNSYSSGSGSGSKSQ